VYGYRRPEMKAQNDADTTQAAGSVTVVGSYIVALVMDVDRIPLEGETLVGSNFHTTHGGKGSNMAVCASRLGASTRFLGKIGRDAFGDKFLELLEEESVDKSSVLVSETLPTAVGFIVFSKKGSNIIVIDTAANGALSPSDIHAGCKAVTSSAVSLAPLEIPLATALTAAAIAKASGRKFILNPAPAVDLRDVDLSSIFALTPNEREGRVCLGLRADDPIPDYEVARQLLELGMENVMLTRGEKGVLWASAAGLQVIPALPVQVVDTVGAGDAFNAGLAVGLSEGMGTLEAIALGVTAASLSTQRRETIASYARRDEVDPFFEKTLNATRAFQPE
jgi:ribokinase